MLLPDDGTVQITIWQAVTHGYAALTFYHLISSDIHSTLNADIGVPSVVESLCATQLISRM